MIEVNRSLYMDEMNGIKSAHYSQLGEVLERLISASDTWIREIDTW